MARGQKTGKPDNQTTGKRTATKVYNITVLFWLSGFPAFRLSPFAWLKQRCNPSPVVKRLLEIKAKREAEAA